MRGIQHTDNNPILRTTGVFSNKIVSYWTGNQNHGNLSVINMKNEEVQGINMSFGSGNKVCPLSQTCCFAIRY